MLIVTRNPHRFDQESIAMAILLEFIDLIVPVALIREKCPGGWEQCIRDHEGLIGGRVWYDTHLFRDGAMSPGDTGLLVDAW